MIKRGYGYKRDSEDHRDKKFYSVSRPRALPPKIDLRPFIQPPWDQYDTNACTGFSTSGAICYNVAKEVQENWRPSAAFIYWNARAREDSTDVDDGAQIRNAIKSVIDNGICSESDWPSSSAIDKKPTEAVFAEARKNLVSQYARVSHSLNGIKGALADGYPIVFGFDVYPQFESDEIASSGLLRMPEDHKTGGHAVLAVGYSDEKRSVNIRNSWGPDWGLRGHFWMPYDYITDPDLCADFWVIKSMII